VSKNKGPFKKKGLVLVAIITGGLLDAAVGARLLSYQKNRLVVYTEGHYSRLKCV
jgi:hypothetical protein